MRVLTLTSLFPGSAEPRHGVFVRERMRDYAARTGSEVRVVAPVPWFPRCIRSRKYARFAVAPRRETFEGFAIEHPRYFMAPLVGVPLQGMSYYVGVRGTVTRELRERPFDVLDAHYAYPDGFAAALLKHRLKVPLVLTVRGTDVNHLPELSALRGQIRFALRQADRVIAVSRALKDCAVAAGALEDRVTVLRNGVDSERFRPLDRAECRARLGLPAHGRVLASVGFLVERKGHDLLLRALALLSPAERPVAVIAGDGPEDGRLRRLAGELGLGEDVRFLGGVAHDRLPEVYSAADVSALCSSREGWPNVLLESLACGTPAVATAVHGSPEVLADPGVGLLVDQRTPESVAAALRRAFAASFDRARVRRYAEGMSWQATSEGLARVFAEAVGEGQ